MATPKKRKRSTADFYKSNPESYRKKLAYDKKKNSTTKARKYRAELARERYARGLKGKGGGDLSHVKGGGFRLESPSKNRARNGHGKNARLASGNGTAKAKKTGYKYKPRSKKK